MGRRKSLGRVHFGFFGRAYRDVAERVEDRHFVVVSGWAR